MIENKCESKTEIYKEKGKSNDYDNGKSYLEVMKKTNEIDWVQPLDSYRARKSFGNVRVKNFSLNIRELTVSE